MSTDIFFIEWRAFGVLARGAPHLAFVGIRLFLVARVPTLFSQLPRASAMTSTSQSQKGPNLYIPRLDKAIKGLSLVKGRTGIPPAELALGVFITILTTIRVRFSPLCNG